MAGDVITTNVLAAHDSYYPVSRLCVSDGTGESGAIVVDKSGMKINGVAVGHMAIERVRGFISGFTSLTLSWDHTTDDVALVLPPGAVDMDFRDVGGLHDPQSTGGTGDLLVTTAGPDSGDLYHLILELRFYK